MSVVRCVVVSALAVAASTSPAAAQVPVAAAEERFDVDADGKLDVIRVGEDATVSVMITGAASDPPWKAFRTTGARVRRATLTVRRFGRTTAILATAEFGKQRSRKAEATEVMVLTWRNGQLAQHLLETIGPQGRDGEWSNHVELTAQGMVRFQSRPGFSRCDGKSYLFADLDDFAHDGARPVAPPVALPADAVQLRADTQAPAAAPGDVRALAFRFTAASIDAHAESAADLAPPRELEDGDPATAWTGFSSAGHYVTARQRSRYDVAALRIVAHDVGEIGLLLDEHAYRVELPRTRAGEPLWVRLDPPVAARCASIIVTKLRRGAEIAELGVLTELELSSGGGAAVLARTLTEGGAAAHTAREQLRELGSAGAAAIMAAIASTKDDKARHRLREALADLAGRGVALDDDAIAELARGFGAPHLSHTQRGAYRRALAAVGARAIDPLAKLIGDGDASQPARVDAVAALAEQTDLAAQQALTGVLGASPRWLRKQVALALGARNPRELPDLVRTAEAARDQELEADVWRAVGLMAHRAAAADGAIDALTARLGEYEALSYELRYRLLVAVAGIEADAAIDAIERLLPAGDDAASVALRRVTIGALSRNAHAAAGPLLARAIDDPDVGTRLLAMDAAASRVDDTTTDTPLLRRLASDRWPRARRAAAAALGARCRRDGVAEAMYGALDADDDFGVQTTVLSTLDTCGEPRIATTLVAVARDKRRAAPLRVHAIRLIGERKDPKLCPLVVDVVGAARREAWSEQGALRVAAAALGALAASCRGDAGAIAALMDAAQDDAFPETQIAALRGLGAVCPSGAKPILERAQRLDHRGVRDAASRSLTACRRRK